MRHGEWGAAGRVAQRVTNQVRLARWIGERAVRTARDAVVAAWAEGATTVVAPPFGGAADSPAGSRMMTSDVAVDGVDERPPTDTAVADGERAEPFEGYDALAAAHLVQRMPRLSAAELVEIRSYEVTHRARRTIVAKIDQLLDERPLS